MSSSRTYSQLLTLFTLFTLLTALFSPHFVAALPINVAIARDVWDPTVLTPDALEGWVVGTQANVTWETNDAPKDISDGSLVILAKGGDTLASGPGSYDEPLAEGFDLRAGFVQVTVPDIEPGDDYQVILFGDSGNFGPVFTISEPLLK